MLGCKIIILSILLFVYQCNCQDALDEFIMEKMKSGNIGGLSASVLKKDKVIWSNAYGVLTPEQSNSEKCNNETIFMLASISKTTMSVALMQLYEKKLFKLDDDINNYLDFTIINPFYPNDKITIEMLLTHTSSISDDGYLSNVDLYYRKGDSNTPLSLFLFDYLSSLGKHYNQSTNFHNSKPGTYFSYSNVGATLAAYLVETILCKLI